MPELTSGAGPRADRGTGASTACASSAAADEGRRAAAVQVLARVEAGWGSESDDPAPPRNGRRRPPPPPDPEGRDHDHEPDPEDVAREIVLNQLAMAPRSRRQLADKLRQRGCADDVADRVLDRMTDVGLVDDEAYAQLVVRSKQATKGLAKRALAHDLRSKGVADETIADALGSIDTESERALAEGVAAKAMRRLAGQPPEIQARRLAGVLGRKGYPPSVVYAVVRQTVNDAPEHQRD